VDGERRLHAARLLQWDRIAAIVEEGELSGTEVVQRQLIANCMRKNLSSMEMARAIDALVKGTNRSKGDVGNMIGLTGPTVSKYLAMLELPPAMQEHVASGALPYSKAYEIRSEEDPAKQSELVERAVKGKLTRDAASAAVKKSKRGRKGAKRPRKRNDAISLKDGRMVTVSGAESSYESWIAALLEAAEVLKTAQADGIAIDKFQKTSKARPAA